MATDALRPESLDDFAGQDAVVSDLKIILGAAKAREELSDHLLLCGPPGLGKTTLSYIVAAELGCDIVVTSGPAIDKPADLVGILARLSRPTVVFIDEIHRLPRVSEEVLYSAMEDGRVDVIVGDGPQARSIPIDVSDFVLVGATTQAGMLSAPMRDRFGYIGRLSLYDDDVLAGIVARSAGLLELNLTGDAAQAIAVRSRGTPRVANMWLRRVRDWAQTEKIDVVDTDVAVAALDAFGVDAAGLDALGRQILTALCTTYANRAVGLSTLATTVGETAGTVEEMYEPFLLRQGFVARTQRGRVATDAGYAHLGLQPPANGPLALFPA